MDSISISNLANLITKKATDNILSPELSNVTVDSLLNAPEVLQPEPQQAEQPEALKVQRPLSIRKGQSDSLNVSF